MVTLLIFSKEHDDELTETTYNENINSPNGNIPEKIENIDIVQSTTADFSLRDENDTVRISFKPSKDYRISTTNFKGN